MSLVMTAAPAVEPVSLSAVRTHLRIDTTDEDALLTSLIATARLQIEAALGLALIEQSWRWTFDEWPESSVVEVPLRPIMSVTTIEVARADASPVTVPTSVYGLDGQSMPARIIADPAALPSPEVEFGGIAVTLVAGYGGDPDDVPAPIRHAILLLVAHWYECREAGSSGGDQVRIPDAVSALLAPYRRVRL